MATSRSGKNLPSSIHSALAGTAISIVSQSTTSTGAPLKPPAKSISSNPKGMLVAAATCMTGSTTHAIATSSGWFISCAFAQCIPTSFPGGFQKEKIDRHFFCSSLE